MLIKAFAKIATPRDFTVEYRTFTRKKIVRFGFRTNKHNRGLWIIGNILLRSASTAIITGATPPCSREQRVPGASFDRNAQPTLALPIKLKKATLLSVTRLSVILLSSIITAWHQAVGNPASIWGKSRMSSMILHRNLTLDRENR
jgi:hypothetical protein